MPNTYTGPAMTLANMRSLGVPSLDVTCQCGREAIVDASHLSGLIEIPTQRLRLRCTECAARSIDVRPDWSQHPAQGRG
jgi:hypothetical protein